MNKIIQYFDLASHRRAFGAAAAPAGNQFPVIPQYAALVLGIIVQPFFVKYQTTGSWTVIGLWGWIAAAVVIGICIFPSVYKKTMDPDKPLFVQLCVIFAAGMGWQSLFQTAVKLAP